MEVLQDQTFIIRGKRSKRSRLSNSPPTLTVDSSSSSTTGEEEGGAGALFEMEDQFTISSSNAQDSRPPSEEEQDMANCLILLAQGQTRDPRIHQTEMGFRCRTCDRCFPSFQALGGHRASHKKPKPTPLIENSTSARVAADHDQLENDRTALTLQIPHSLIVKSKVHECSVCGAEFSSGQALGGHMRRHRPIATAIVPSLPSAVGQITDSETRRNLHCLDLNLPAPEDDCRDLSNFPFSSSGGKVIVFSAGSAMVDCHY